MMYYYGDLIPFHMFGFGLGLGFILPLLFWGMLVWGAITFFRHGTFNGNDRALDILKERYAKGEITKEQFETMKKDLQ